MVYSSYSCRLDLSIYVYETLVSGLCVTRKTRVQADLVSNWHDRIIKDQPARLSNTEKDLGIYCELGKVSRYNCAFYIFIS